MGKVSLIVHTSSGAAVKTQIHRESGFINFGDLTTTYLLVGGCVLFYSSNNI